MSKLSFDKLTKLLSKHNYAISTIYHCAEDGEDNILYVEARLPKTQKGFIIEIPQNYVMILPHSDSRNLPPAIELVDAGSKKLSDVSNRLTDKSVKYINDARGPLLDIDLVFVSSEGFCYSKFNGRVTCYFFGSNLPENDEDQLDEEQINKKNDPLTLLEEEMLKVAKRNGIRVSQPTPIEVKNTKKEKVKSISKNKAIKVEEIEIDIVDEPQSGEPQDEPQSGEPPTDGDKDDEKVELVFVGDKVDKTGHPTEDGDVAKSSSTSAKAEDSIDIDDKDGIPSDNEDVEKIGSLVEQSEDPHNYNERSNCVFPEEIDVNLGIVYVAISIIDFYHKIDDTKTTIENRVLQNYEKLEDNETDMRRKKIETLKKNMTLAMQHLDLSIKNLTVTERSLKYQLLRMATLLKNAEDLKDNYVKKLTKEGQVVTSQGILAVDSVHHKTRKVAHELNMQLLHKKDEIDDLLLHYETNIAELF